MRDGYGQTETVLICGNYPSLEVRPGSMGKPSPCMKVAVIDEIRTTLDRYIMAADVQEAAGSFA